MATLKVATLDVAVIPRGPIRLTVRTVALPWLLVPSGLMIVISLIGPSIFYPRYVLHSVAALALAAGAGLSHAVSWAARRMPAARLVIPWAAPAVLAAFTGPAQVAIRQPLSRPDNLRELAHTLRDSWRLPSSETKRAELARAYGADGYALVEAVYAPLSPLWLRNLPAVQALRVILWINLLTHGLPGVALGGEPAIPGAMASPPRPPTQSILGAGLWQRLIRIAVVLTAVTLGVAVWAFQTGRPWQSMAFFALGATQLGVALGSRTRPGSLANPMLLLAVAGAFVLQLAGLYFPPLREVLSTEPLPLGDLLIVTALSTLGYAA
ncbi:MAG TPA: cation-translocating P-type ATPase C-terminal domain-containing protein, partial [Nonomuraea sp.]|nr:cation-translocating P-type ATPase C-terminal domain-containing protein [Nonomuraea sp.]